MAKTANINLRIDPETKKKAEALFSSFGISVTDALNIFINKSIMEDGFPFEVKKPRYNKETEESIKEARNIIAGKIKAKKYNSFDEILDELKSK